MTKVYVKYNPCTLGTEIAVNGVWVQSPSKLASFNMQKLQIWAAAFLPTVVEACGDSQYDMEFFGTQVDYNDLVAGMNSYLATNPNIQVNLMHTASPELDAARASVYAKLEDIEAYCQNFEGKDFEEIYAKKKEIEPLPGILFSSYITRLFDACTAKENAEKAAYFTQIEELKLDSVATTTKEIQGHNYSDACKAELMLALEKRKLFCQREDLETLTAGLLTISRQEVKALMAQVVAKEYDRSLTEEYLTKINAQNDSLEQSELNQMAGKLEGKDIEELKQINEKIAQGGFQQRFADQYITAIAAQIETLHVRNMEQYCVIVPTVDRENVLIIKNKIDAEECNPSLKVKYYDMISQRLETLDYEALCAKTEGMEKKSVAELEELYKALETGNYNMKFVKDFLVKVRICSDKKKAEQVESMVEPLDTMTKDQVNALAAQITALNYADRFTYIARERITERVFLLDMQELMGMCNDFDALTLADINELRIKMSQKEVCQRAQYYYSMKLAEREKIVGVSNVSSQAAYAKQLADQMGLAEANLAMPLYTTHYDALLEEHFRDMGARNFLDIPFLFVPDCPGLAFSKNQVFYKTAEGFATSPITDIRLVATEKKLFSESIVITFGSGAVVTLAGGVSKKLAANLVNYLVTIVNNVNNAAVMAQYQPYSQHVEPISEAAIGLRTLPQEVDFEVLTTILGNKVNPYAEKNIKVRGCENWANLEPKIVNGMGINPIEKVAAYYDRTMLNTAKDGFVFGDYYISVKNGNRGFMQLPYAQIFQLTRLGAQLNILTTNNSSVPTEFTVASEQAGNAIVEAFNEFVGGMQCLEPKSAQVIVPIQATEQPVQEFCFCTQCGTKLPIGSAFCTQCGTRLN